ncbi:hypothetical protein EXIGLDRAFT_270812 [Exidia glandulosa HHB12029]|uniref:F-box domain-containing protein n=1 Tax=Exidia glandulosa HHB12029 TaxID=1314781 RepID=A0A165DMX6_EXIGL|nr:hypothetical protein EXIGLDRAFT_270812 [Exidia glandulosa HHB12029]
MPLLEKLLLRLSTSNVRGLDMTSPGRHILTLCPKLRILNTGDLPFAFIDPKTLPVLESYTTDSHLELDSLLEATRVWPKLTRLEIASVGTASSAVIGFRPAVMDLPLLETLVCRDADNPLHAIAADRLPALKHLDVFAAESAWLGIDAFLRNPQQTNNLTTLTLTATHSNIIVDCWPPTINRLSNLESLRVVGFSAAGLEAFLTPWEHSYYLPEKLQEVHLIGCQFSGEAIECLIGWISRRNASTRNSPIKSLRIEHNGTNKARSELFPSWMVARLEQLVDNVKVQSAETYVPAFLEAS